MCSHKHQKWEEDRQRLEHCQSSFFFGQITIFHNCLSVDILLSHRKQCHPPVSQYFQLLMPTTDKYWSPFVVIFFLFLAIFTALFFSHNFAFFGCTVSIEVKAWLQSQDLTESWFLFSQYWKCYTISRRQCQLEPCLEILFDYCNLRVMVSLTIFLFTVGWLLLMQDSYEHQADKDKENVVPIFHKIPLYWWDYQYWI